MADYIWLIPVMPGIGFLINGFLGRKLPKGVVSFVACLALFISFVVSALIFLEFLKLAPDARLFDKNIYDWIVSGDFTARVGFRIDSLSIIMCLVVTGVGFLIHVYSAGYMHDDEGYARYFTYLNLFVFMMLILVTANNMLLMFVGWEGVGLCSYLLIGFWYKKDSAANAGKKAFIVNRIGDFGFLLGVFFLLTTLGAPRRLDARFRRASEKRPSDYGLRRDDHYAALLRGRNGQVRPDPSLRLAARRDGRSDACQLAHPCGDDGYGRRLHDRQA